MKTVSRLARFVWRKIGQSWSFMWQSNNRFFKIAGVVAVPSAFLRSYQDLTIDFSLVLFMASLYCVLSLIYLTHGYEKVKSKKLGEIYTLSSGRFLQVLGVSLMQALTLIPGLFGISLALFVVSLGFNSLLLIPSALLVVASMIALTRLSIAHYIASCEGLGMWRSVKGSISRTKAKTMRIMSRYLVFFAVILALTVTIFGLINLAKVLAQSWFVQGAVSAVLVTIVLPWFVIFGYSIYDEASR